MTRITSVRITRDLHDRTLELVGVLQRHTTHRVTQNEALEYAVERALHEVEQDDVAYPATVDGEEAMILGRRAAQRRNAKV